MASLAWISEEVITNSRTDNVTVAIVITSSFSAFSGHGFWIEKELC